MHILCVCHHNHRYRKDHAVQIHIHLEVLFDTTPFDNEYTEPGKRKGREDEPRSTCERPALIPTKRQTTHQFPKLLNLQSYGYELGFG